MTRSPAPLDPQEYEPDEDGSPREIVGAWAKEKYERLAKYVDISRGVRAGFVRPGKAGATYIEPFAGPGRVRIKSDGQVTHGSPLVAWLESARTKTAFTEVHVADADPRLIAATETRLRSKGAPTHPETGTAEETVTRIVRKLNRHALHFAFLDPYNLAALPFEVIKRLAELKRMDILIHVSVQDLNRNILRYLEAAHSPVDIFAPGWRDHVDEARSIEHVRGKLFEYWRSLLRTINMDTAEAAEIVRGANRQPLYWLAFAARHERALEFWDKIRNIEPKTESLF